MNEYVIDRPTSPTFEVSSTSTGNLQVTSDQHCLAEDEVICLVLDPGESAEVHFCSDSDHTIAAVDERSNTAWPGSATEVSQVLTARIDEALEVTLELGPQPTPNDPPQQRKVYIKTRAKGTLPGAGF